MPERIKDSYNENKKKSHYSIKNYDYDIISVILSVIKINHSAENFDETKKNINYLKTSLI